MEVSLRESGTAAQAILGARSVLRGLTWIRQPGLRWYCLVPLLLNAVLFGALALLAIRWTRPGVDWLVEHSIALLAPVLWVLFAAAFLLLLLQTFAFTSTLVGAPFYGFLAQAVERRLRGEDAAGPSGLRELLAEVRYSLVQELRKSCYLLVSVLPFLAFFLVPGLQLLAPPLFLLYSSWAMALECLDFPMANHRIPLREERRLLRGVWALALGFGGTTLLLALVPLVNLVAIPAAVAGGTELWVRYLQPLAGAMPSASSTRRT